MNQPIVGDRHRVVVLFTLTGAALGVVLAMLTLTRGGDGYGQTDIEMSVPLTLLTTAVGSVVGAKLASRPGSVGWAVTVGVLSLTGLIGASMGWLIGDLAVRQTVPPGRAMAVGSLCGLFVGLLALAPRWLKRTGTPTGRM